MKLAPFISLIIYLFLHISVQAQDFWQQAKGTEGGNISLLATRPDGVSFASNGTRLFRRALHDVQWREVNVPTGRRVTSLVIDQYSGVIVGTDRGVYRSATSGDTWGKYSDDTLKVENLFYDIRFGLFALRQIDAWYQLMHFKTELQQWENVRNVSKYRDVICFDTAGVWYVANDEGSRDTARNPNSGVIQRSLDKGKSWEQVKSYSSQYYMETYQYNTFSLLVSKNNQLWLGVSGWYWDSMHRKPLGGGIFSTFNGESWKSYLNDGYYSSALCFTQDSAGNIFIGSKKGVYKTQNDSITYIGLSDFSIHSLCADKGGNIYAGAQDDGVYLLKTGATEWIKWNEGIDVAKVNRIVKSPNGEIFAAMSNGLFTSQDNGRTWNEIYKRHTTSLALDGGKIFAGNDSGDILFSTDKLEWNRRPSAISRTSTYVYSIAFKDSVLLSSFRGRVRSWYGGILEYDDGRVDRFPQQNVAEWKFPRGNNITLFNDFKDFFTVESGTLYGSQSFVKSSHDGIDWKIIFSGPKVNDIHFSFSNKPYIATDSGIYRRDGETVFTKLNFPFKTTALATAKDGIMYAASDSAIYRSDDEWKNWEDVSKGIRGKVSNLAVTQDGHIVAGTAENGLFVSSERTYSVLKVADFIRECGRHTITIQGDSLHDFKSIIADNASIEILNDESASVLTVRILQSDHLKPGEYSFTISDILGRKLEFGNSLPQINFPRIIQGGDTLRTNIHARAYQWFKDSSPVNGATHEFLKIRQSGTYSLKVTDTNHCEITSEPFVAIASSVHAFKNYGGFTSQFLPMENAVVVKLPESLLGEISITDQMGNIIFKKNIETTGTSYRILARDFPQGMYYICFKTGFLSLQDRFVIVRY